MAKEFSYRGKKLEELEKMDLKEFAELLPARKRRTIKRGLTNQQKKLLERIREQDKDSDDAIRTHCRNMIILPEMVDHKIAIYDGEEFKYRTIQPEMIGHYLGEFTQTREQVEHSAAGIGATRSTKFISVR